jgi:hypothetical protein
MLPLRRGNASKQILWAFNNGGTALMQMQDLQVGPRDIVAFYNQVALKDGIDDHKIDNLNLLRQKYSRNPFGASVRL